MSKTNAPASPVMNSRKYLTIINNSPFAIGKVVTESFRNLTGLKHLLPVGFDGDRLMIEDRQSGAHYAVKYSNIGGNFVIESYDRLNIINNAGHKSEAFDSFCTNLVEAIVSDVPNKEKINESFNKVASHRFSRRSIPDHGIVKTRDGVVHKIVVAEEITSKQNSVLAENIGKAFKNGQKLLNEESISNVTNVKFCTKRFTARNMRTIAESASKDAGFQRVVAHIAKKIDNHNLTEAVAISKEFFKEFQEFSVLDKKRFQKLIDESLAASGVFGSQLIRDTSELMWKTNAIVNRDAIIKEWREAAKSTGSNVLLENVSIIADSPTFDKHLDQFIQAIFCEAVGPRDVQASAYSTALKSLLAVPQIRSEPSMTNRITDLIERLQVEGDSYAILEAEEVLANANMEANDASTNIDNFDQVSDGIELPDLSGGGTGGETAGSASNGGVTFNININGKDVDAKQEPIAPPAPDMSMGMEDAIGGSTEPAAPPANSPAPPAPDQGGTQGSGLTFESYESYANLLKEHDGEWPQFFGYDYGVSPLSYEDTAKASKRLQTIIQENSDTEANLTSLAFKAISDSGFVIQKNRLEEAACSVVNHFVVDCVDILQEAQYKFPKFQRRGLERGSLHNEDEKNSKGKKSEKSEISESYVYTHADSGVGMLIEGSGDNYLVSNVSGSIREPIPTNIVPSMLFAVKAKDVGDAKLFEEWIAQGINQFLIDEDATVVTVDTDGTVSVDQTDDMTGETVNIAEIQPVTDDMAGMGGMGDEFGGMDDMGDEPAGDIFDAEETVDDAPNGDDAGGPPIGDEPAESPVGDEDADDSEGSPPPAFGGEKKKSGDGDKPDFDQE